MSLETTGYLVSVRLVAISVPIFKVRDIPFVGLGRTLDGTHFESRTNMGGTVTPRDQKGSRNWHWKITACVMC